MRRKYFLCMLLCVLLLFTACEGNAVASEQTDGQVLTNNKIEYLQTEGEEMEVETESVLPSQSSSHEIDDLEEVIPSEGSNTQEEFETTTPKETTDQTQAEESESESSTEDKPIEEEIATTRPTDTNNTEEDEDMNANYRLVVAGQDITQKNYFHINKDSSVPYNADLPLLAVVKCYGADVNWKSTTVAEITLNGGVYILNLSDVSLVKEGSSFNCIIPVPGGRVYYKVVGNELVLDDKTLCTILGVMEINAEVRVDYQSNIVTVQ